MCIRCCVYTKMIKKNTFETAKNIGYIVCTSSIQWERFYEHYNLIRCASTRFIMTIKRCAKICEYHTIRLLHSIVQKRFDFIFPFIEFCCFSCSNLLLLVLCFFIFYHFVLFKTAMIFGIKLPTAIQKKEEEKNTWKMLKPNVTITLMLWMCQYIWTIAWISIWTVKLLLEKLKHLIIYKYTIFYS